MSNANPSIGVEVIVTLDMAKDICEALGLGNVSQAISRLDDDEKGIYKIDTLGGEQWLKEECLQNQNSLKRTPAIICG